MIHNGIYNILLGNSSLRVEEGVEEGVEELRVEWRFRASIVVVLTALIFLEHSSVA